MSAAVRAGALLFRKLRTYQIYGANTEVGKTVWSTILCSAAKRRFPHDDVTYLKPVSTGPEDEADNLHLKKFAHEQVSTQCLHQYELPVSPHIAANISQQHVPSDYELLAGIHDSAHRLARQPGWLFVETAGGVHSPGPSGTTQADLYAPLRLPVVLVGDSKLGGIGTTISAYESLKLRGYDVWSVLLFKDAIYGNADYLTQYFAPSGVPVTAVPPPHERLSAPEDEFRRMSSYYEAASSSTAAQGVLDVLAQRHRERAARLESMAAQASEKIWYPFTQHTQLSKEKITVIDSAHGNDFQTATVAADRESLLQSTFDGSASWWTQGLGHANPQLTLAAAYAAGRYGHVMFAEAIHEPALALAERLLEGMPGSRLQRVFYSDNGSTGMEVAVKMGLRAARKRYGWGADEKLCILGLKGSYHGDTIGTMDCTEPSTYNEEVEWYEGKGFWFDYPTVMMTDGQWSVNVPADLEGDLGAGQTFAALGDIFDVETRETGPEGARYEHYIKQTLARLQAHGQKFGALVLEPVILGAGGMNFVDPLFQRTLVRVVRAHPQLFGTTAADVAPDDGATWTGLPVVFDEVFTGLYRLGAFSSASFLGVAADVSVHAKLLTGGLVPLCVTLASESVFAAFASDDKRDALLHGHSYTAHPVGCQVAVESVRTMQAMEQAGAWDWAKQGWASASSSSSRPQPWSVWHHGFVTAVSQQRGRVDGVWAMGSVLAMHLTDGTGQAGYTSNAARALQQRLWAGDEAAGDGRGGNVHSRVLGNVLYLMTGQTTTEADVARVEALVMAYFEETVDGGMRS